MRSVIIGSSLSLAVALTVLPSVGSANTDPSTCRVTQAKEDYARAHNEIVKKVHTTINEQNSLEELNFGEMVTQCIGSYGVRIGGLASLADALINRVEDAARSKCSEIKDYIGQQTAGLEGSFDAPFDLGTIGGGATSGQGWGVNSELDPEAYKKRSIEVWEEQQRRLQQVRDGIQGARSGYQGDQSNQARR